MIEVNFCPQCATARLGRFCAGCGLNLEDLHTLLATHASPSPSETVPKPEIPVTAPDATRGLVYGDAYNSQTDCGNCGSPLSDGVCVLCSD
jgi:hypothetical protein